MQSDKYSEQIVHNGKILALVFHTKELQNLEDSKEKMPFLTPDDFPFQFAIQKRSKEEFVEPHFHVPFKELKDFPVQEFLYILSGKAKVSLYSDNGEMVEEIVLKEGDGVVLNAGHGVEFLEDVKFLNLKQGPYRGHKEEKKLI